MQVKRLFKIQWTAIFVIGVKAIIETNPELKIKVSVFGTPAEERGGGKIQMLQDGCFDDVDMVLMSHPMRYEIPRPTYLAKCEFNVKFRGINLSGIYLFRVNNGNARTIMSIVCLTILSG